MVMAGFFYVDQNLTKHLTRQQQPHSPFFPSMLYLCATPPYTVLLNVHFTGDTMDEKSSYEELLYSLCGAGKTVSSEGTGSVVSCLALCADQVPDPGTPLTCGLEKIQPSVHMGIRNSLFSLSNWKVLN